MSPESTQSGIFPENLPSMALHGSRGFRCIGLTSASGRIGAIWRVVLLLGTPHSLVAESTKSFDKDRHRDALRDSSAA